MMPRLPVNLLALAALGLACAGCPTPGQGGGLAEVDVSGFAARMRALCRSGVGAQAGQGACGAPDAAPDAAALAAADAAAADGD